MKKEYKKSKLLAICSILLFSNCVLTTLLYAQFSLADAGSLDPTFDIGSGAHSVETVAVQADGKIVIGGDFTMVNGTTRNRIACLNADGSLDTSFDPGSGVSGPVYAVAVQTDSKIIIGGNFSTVNGTTRRYIARLNADGALETSFNPSSAIVKSTVEAVVVQADGTIIIGGGMDMPLGGDLSLIARLNTDGSVYSYNNGADEPVYAVAVQADGKIIIGGAFTAINGTTHNRIARLDANGLWNANFSPSSGANDIVQTVAVQADGKIIIGGSFIAVNGTTRNRIARLNADGSLDDGFNPGSGANAIVQTVAVQADGKIIVGGGFTNYNGLARNGIARIHSGDSDSDGIEDAADRLPLDPTETIDTDNDGIGNNADTDDDGDGVLDVSDNCSLNSNLNQLNTDSDTQGNVCDSDDDNDGVADPWDDFPLHAAASLDADSDSSPDGWNAGCDVTCQADSGLTLDNCPSTDNANQLNTDADAQGDACDMDDDNDSILDVPDNCPLIVNIDQLNSDSDTLGDVCDTAPFTADAGLLDTAFNLGSGANNSVYAVAVQADGKIIIGGDFTTVNGTTRNRIARLNADGSLDTGFDSGNGVNSSVYAVAVQADGKIVIGGGFAMIDGTSRNRIARLNADGSLDVGFNPGSGANAIVQTVVVQTDGKILIGGDFIKVNGTTRNRIARLDANGLLDAGFSPGSGANDIVQAVAVQADGKIIIGGVFTTINGTTRNRIARFDANGSLDAGFSPGSGANNVVQTVAVQTDGKIIIGGSFIGINGTRRNGIARLNADGSLDTSFDPFSGVNGTVRTVAVQADGKIIIGGGFITVSGTTRNSIARLNADGSLDVGFNPGSGANAIVQTVAVQADGKIIVGGGFTNYNGLAINHIARIHSGDSDSDSMEDAADRFPLDPTETIDADNDGIGNNADTDDDNDGMPDTWELQYNFNPLLNDASGDADGDGLTNLQEFTNGSNPVIARTQNDYNADGIAGWVWQGVGNGNETASQNWQLTFPFYSANWAVPNRFYHPSFPDQVNWDIVTSGDFNKDGDADIVWRHNSSDAWKIWQMQDGLRVAQTNWTDAFDPTHTWTVIGSGDTDKDGDDDIILNNTITGEVLIWEMQNHAVVATYTVGTKAGYTLNRIGDFNKDSDVDLLFRENGSDVLVTWEIESNAYVTERALANTGTNYNPVCAGDFDKDGDDDIMLINSATQQEKWFVMENYARTQQFGGTNEGFTFLGCGDYDGDGDTDSLWKRNSDELTRVVLQQNWGATKQTVYSNAFGGANGFVYRGNNN